MTPVSSALAATARLITKAMMSPSSLALALVAAIVATLKHGVSLFIASITLLTPLPPSRRRCYPRCHPSFLLPSAPLLPPSLTLSLRPSPHHLLPSWPPPIGKPSNVKPGRRPWQRRGRCLQSHQRKGRRRRSMPACCGTTKTIRSCKQLRA